MKPITKTFVGLKLHKGQKEIRDIILNSSAMFYTITTPRQWGKSTFAIQMMLYYAINEANCNIMFTSLSYRQCSKVYRNFVRGIENSGIIKSKNNTENSLTLINGSEIYFVSIATPDTLLGYDITYMFMDESSRYKKDTFERVLRPMLRTRGKKCFLISTPCGKNWFYEMYVRGKENERYCSYIGNADDNPFSNKEEFEDARKILPPSVFRQEYLAEFIDDNGDVFQNINLVATNAWPAYNENIDYYAAVDVGRNNDFTVLTVMGEDGRIYEILRINKKEWDTIAKEVAGVINKFKPRTTMVEVNGVGDVFFELLKKYVDRLTPWVTTNDSKQQIIEELILEFQNQTIKIPGKNIFEHLELELQDFTFKYSPQTRKISYKARTDHDDCVMSLAMANHAKKTRLGSYLRVEIMDI